MSLGIIILTILVVGFLWWLIDQIPVIDPTFKRIAKIVLIFFLVVWLIQGLGLLSSLDSIRVGPIR